jgi:hypothetical protein
VIFGFFGSLLGVGEGEGRGGEEFFFFGRRGCFGSFLRGMFSFFFFFVLFFFLRGDGGLGIVYLSTLLN